MVQYGALTFCTVIVTISHTPEGVDREIKVRHRTDILLLLLPLNPLTRNLILAHFVAKSGPFGRLVGAAHPSRTRYFFRTPFWT